MQQKLIDYDATGDGHYDTISALIKSIRGSDPDAAVYWLAKMLEAGEDVRFLCRRLVILASEDVGNADPQALSLAVAAMQACEFVGLPECQLTLSQAVTYLACAPKSECRHQGDLGGPSGYPRGQGRTSAQTPARHALCRCGKTWQWRRLSVCTRPRGWDRGAGLSGCRARVLRSRGPRIRSDAAGKIEGNPATIEGKLAPVRKSSCARRKRISQRSRILGQALRSVRATRIRAFTKFLQSTIYIGWDPAPRLR